MVVTAKLTSSFFSFTKTSLSSISLYQKQQIVWYNVVVLFLWHLGFLYALFYLVFPNFLLFFSDNSTNDNTTIVTTNAGANTCSSNSSSDNTTCADSAAAASWSELSILWLFFWTISGLGITAGAHRLWAHKSYCATTGLKVFLMCMNSMAFQGSILEWSRDHRVHHKGSETDADPHNAKRGFFFSHCGWVMVRKHAQVMEQGKKNQYRRFTGR